MQSTKSVGIQRPAVYVTPTSYPRLSSNKPSGQSDPTSDECSEGNSHLIIPIVVGVCSFFVTVVVGGLVLCFRDRAKERYVNTRGCNPEEEIFKVMLKSHRQI